MVASKIGRFGHDYLLLGLRIGEHQDNYVDYYYGPPEIKERVAQEPKITPKQLHKDCSSLQKKVLNQAFDAKREKYFEKMLKAMEVTIERDLRGGENGKIRSVEEDFKQQTDMELRPFKESILDDLKARAEKAYGGAGTLSERMDKMREKRIIPETKVKEAFLKGLDITEQKTRELYPGMLPEEEDIEVVVKSNIGWGAYDWYLGNFKSLVEINPKSMYWTSFLRLGSHEGYPGHHTEFAVAEYKLYRKENHFERAILLYNTPYMIICEGIAGVGVNTLFSYREQEEIALREFCPDPKNGPSIEELLQQNMVRKDVIMIEFNAAYYKFAKGYSDEEVIKYIKKFEIHDNDGRKNMIERMNKPVYKLVDFAPKLGRDLIIGALGEIPSPKKFRYLLENPVLPSDLM